MERTIRSTRPIQIFSDALGGKTNVTIVNKAITDKMIEYD